MVLPKYCKETLVAIAIYFIMTRLFFNPSRWLPIKMTIWEENKPIVITKAYLKKERSLFLLLNVNFLLRQNEQTLPNK